MINAAMSVIALKELGEYPKYSLVLIENKDKNGFCGFNINLNFALDKSYEDARKEIQDDIIKILTLIRREQDLSGHIEGKWCNNVPEGTEINVELIRIEAISFTKDRGEGALKEAYPDLHEFIQENFKVKEFKYTPFGMTIFYQVELENTFKIKL